MVFIQDGKGRGFTAEVDSDNHLHTFAFTLAKVGEISKEAGRAFSWTNNHPVALGSVMFYLQNTSPTRNLIIDDIDVSVTAAATYEVLKGTGVGGGTVISGVNLNFSSSNDPEAISFGGQHVTNEGSGGIVGIFRIPADDTGHFPARDAIILGQNDILMIKKQAGATGSDSVIVEGYYE
ncbi:MAG: hypothetical protein IH948_04635 [Bacteroidetes bacterium]|nr:hypothetical protein [Bacteroidota bacterium]